MNLQLLRDDLAFYLQKFKGRWTRSERKKWYHVKQFQDNFDLGADDLADMLNKSIHNSCMAGTTSPRNMLIKIAQSYPREIRNELTYLFDNGGGISIDDRIRHYLNTLNELTTLANQNRQDPYPSSGQNYNATSELLSLKYPEMYCPYRLGLSQCSDRRYELGINLKSTDLNKNEKSNLIISTLRDALRMEQSFIDVVRPIIDSDSECYSDTDLLIAVADFTYFVKNYIVNAKTTERYWWIYTDPSEFSFDSLNELETVEFFIHNQNGKSRKYKACFDAVMQGHKVIGYESTPTQKIVAVCSISAESDGQKIEVQLDRKLENPISYDDFRSAPELENSVPIKKGQCTLCELTKDEYDYIISIIDERNPVSAAISQVEQPVPNNQIYYGIPGCGKSYRVDEYVRDELGIEDKSDNKIRTTFYLDYSYNDFIGQLAPQTVGGTIEYKIKPGPFTMALAQAYKCYNNNLPVVLIVEEINRGNAPAIFGDIFQLLDRDDNGESIYDIVNPVINQYLNEENIDNPFTNKIKIPKNLWIIATMNSSDQNVFKLDTAFKRRWDMHRMTNKSVKLDADGKNKFDVPGMKINWIDFVDKVNKQLEKNDINEDRQLGYWFLVKKSIDNIDDIGEKKECFANKVLEYLWNDVLKFHDKDVLFNNNIKSFDDLVEQYKKDAESVFIKEVLNG